MQFWTVGVFAALAALVFFPSCNSTTAEKSKTTSEYSEVLVVDSPQAHEALAVAMRVSKASTRLEARKLNEDMLRSLLNVAFQGEDIKIDELIDLKKFLRVIGRRQTTPPPQP